MGNIDIIIKLFRLDLGLVVYKLCVIFNTTEDLESVVILDNKSYQFAPDILQ